MGNRENTLRITWVTRSFLDYRIPVYEALDKLVSENLCLIFSKEYVPERVYAKARKTLGERAIGLSGEWKIGSEDRGGFANSKLSFRFHPALLKIIGQTKPEVLIGDGFFKWSFAALLHRLLRQVPLVICYERTFHTERNAQWYRTLFRRAVVKATDAMCCNGKLSEEYCQWLGMDPGRITYGHMVADTKGLARKASDVHSIMVQRLRSECQISGTLFLYVGSLSPRKGVEQLLKTWALFEAKHGNGATFMLVGDGELRNELEEFCKERGLKGVRFVGTVDYEKVAEYYAAADVFIMPTLEDNWSLVVPEAMACGLPVLCSKYNGCWPELVHDGINGWVLDPLKPDDILRVLELCIDNRKKLKSMGEQSREIGSHFSPENAAKSILEACTIALNIQKGQA